MLAAFNYSCHRRSGVWRRLLAEASSSYERMLIVLEFVQTSKKVRMSGYILGSFHQIHVLDVHGADQVSKVNLWRNLRCPDKQELSPSDDNLFGRADSFCLARS